jgi:hypothetical protein
MKLKNSIALSLLLLFLLMLSACGSSGSTGSDPGGSGDQPGGSSNQPVVTTTTTSTDTNSPSTISMLECEAMPNVSDGNGGTFTAYTMPNIPDPNSFTGISGAASMCVAGDPASDGTATVNVPSDLNGCQASSVNFQSGSVITAYEVPNGDTYCIATNGS